MGVCRPKALLTRTTTTTRSRTAVTSRKAFTQPGAPGYSGMPRSSPTRMFYRYRVSLSNQSVWKAPYAWPVPKLWAATIEAHHRTVRDAILDTTVVLAQRDGLASLTMSQIAGEAGVGRATLYKYFPDVEAILVAWHERHVDRHIAYLTEVRDRSKDPATQLEAVLEAYALIPHERALHHGGLHEGPRGDHARRGHAAAHTHSRKAGDVSALVHRTEHVADAQRRLSNFLRDVLGRAARAGLVRRDVPTDELARYCLSALAASGTLRSRTGVKRLVAVTMAGLRPARR